MGVISPWKADAPCYPHTSWREDEIFCLILVKRENVIRWAIVQSLRSATHLHGGDTSDNRIGRNIFGYNSSCSDHGSFPDGYPGEYDRSDRNPGIILHTYWASFGGKDAGLRIVLQGVHEYLTAHIDMAAQGDPAASIKFAAFPHDSTESNRNLIGFAKAKSFVQNGFGIELQAVNTTQ